MIEVAQDEIYAPSDTSLVPKRGWITLFEDVCDATFRVRREPSLPPPTSEAAEFLGLEITHTEPRPDRCLRFTC